MKKNICIIHFNTPILTRCLVRSINKYTPGANIYIFDNSNKEPFVNYFDNVTVLDNTKGQLIDFNEVLQKYPGRLKSRGKTNSYGSAKHSMSIQKCIELIGEDFVLLDSDVLLKRDISPIWNENYVWIAGVEDWTNKTLVGATKRKRVCPFLLYMNVKKMNELGITFYDDKHMLGLNNGPKCEEYETGVWMYETTPKNQRRIINYNDYILHFRAGSWLEDARTKQHYKQINPLKWLERHKDKWLKPGESLGPDWKTVHVKEEKIFNQKRAISMNFEKIFDHIYCLHYLPDASRLPELKEEFKRVGINESAPYFSWKYDFPSSLLDCVFDNKKLNMDISIRASGRKYIKRVSMRHYEIIKEAYALGYNRILILENDIRFHNDLEYIEKMLKNVPDSDIVMFDKMTCSAPAETIKYKQYVKSLSEDTLYGSMNDSGVFFIFCSCYALNRTGMKHIIDTQEAKLFPPDTPFNDKSINGMFAITNLAIQDPKLKTRKNETYDKIGLDTSVYGKKEEPNSTDGEVVVAISKPVIKREPEKKVTEKLRKAINKERNSHVVFRVPTKPQARKKLEPVPTLKAPVQKPLPKSTGPLVTKRAILLDKKIIPTHTRVISGKNSGFNKLYEQ